IDEVRIYNRALSQAEIQADMNTPVAGTLPPADSIPPSVTLISPAAGATVSSMVSVTANATDNVGVGSVAFFLDGQHAGGGHRGRADRRHRRPMGRSGHLADRRGALEPDVHGTDPRLGR